MSIVCNTCGHDNQNDALFCDECGVELTANTLSSGEEKDMTSEKSHIEVADNEAEFEARPYAYAEVGNSESEVASEDNSYSEVNDSESEIALDQTGEIESSPSAIPIGAATRLELDEPPIQEMVSPATTLEFPELPKAVLINLETEEKFILPSEEKTAYIGRLNDEFAVQVDLSNIENADLISRVHAAIHYENEAYYLEDAGSANGTWLNKKPIQPGIRFRQQLNPGDTIAFGRNQTVEFMFDLED